MLVSACICIPFLAASSLFPLLRCWLCVSVALDPGSESHARYVFVVSLFFSVPAVDVSGTRRLLLLGFIYLHFSPSF